MNKILSMMEDEKMKDSYYLVFGDNAKNSIDSRSSTIGPIHRDDIVGRAIFRLWPFGGIK